MGYQSGFHAPNGSADFLGFRKTHSGVTEVIYDDGVSRRVVWKVMGTQINEASLSDGLCHAVCALRVVPALISELSKRSITLERVSP